MKTRGRPFSRAGIELRGAIRANIDANPAMTHQDLQRKFGVAQSVIESAMTRTVAEWDAYAGMIIEPVLEKITAVKSEITVDTVKPSEFKVPGLEQGFVKFKRKPAKMGDDYIFWIPRVYIKNGLVDPNAEYEIYLRKESKKEPLRS
nr:hypothetical protein [Candidatus Sigynarchaeota archaeon]